MVYTTCRSHTFLRDCGNLRRKMENTAFKTPKSVLARMQVVHLGKILSNLQFAAVAVMAASVLSFIVPAIYYIFLIAVSVLTLFSIFAWYPEFASWWGGGETLVKVAGALAESWKYTVPVLLVLAAGSIVCLCFDKQTKHTARIAFSAIFAVLALIVLALKFINNGGVQ